MPSLYPAASFSQAMEVLQTQDAMIKQIPEVANVLGKIGRVDSALDPAPAAMIETHVMLKPRSEWRTGMTGRGIWDEINAVATMPGIPLASPKTNARLLWLGPLLDLDDPGAIETTADQVSWFLNRVPLGLIPLVLLINLLLLYLDFRSLSISIVVFSGIPVAFAGGMVAVAVMGIDMNTAVWVGFIALFGIAVDDGVVMATYISQLLKKREPNTIAELRATIYEAGMKRV